MWVSTHAQQMYQQRLGKNMEQPDLVKEILAIVFGGEPVKPKYPAIKLLNNGLKDAKYYARWGVIAVVVNQTVVTTFRRNKGAFVGENLCR